MIRGHAIDQSKWYTPVDIQIPVSELFGGWMMDNTSGIFII
jgi:hypothetical protein